MLIKLSKFCFFFLFIFTPLAFGTTEPWSYAIMEITAGLAAVFFFLHILKNNESVYQVPGLIPLLLFLLFILLQIVPLPPMVIKWLSPHAFDIHQTIWSLTDTEYGMTLSINPKATVLQFFRYSTYVLYYILTVQLLKDKSMLQTTVLIIAFFGGLLAFSSILQFYLTEDMALWFRHSPSNSIVVGPYANHNHYAGLMEMMFPVVLGLFLFYRPRIGNTSLIKGIAEMFAQEKANIHILIGASALLIVVSIFVSLSRGAMISTCLALFLFTFLLLKRRINKSNTMLLIAVIMIAALTIGWFGWDQIFDRFASLKKAQGVIYESRLDFWKDTSSIIRSYPITGSGIGTFPHIYPSHRTIISGFFLTHAHNDYLELLAESGLVGFGLITCFFLSFIFKTCRVFAKRRDAFSIYLYMGSITAILSILIHSFTDFNLQIGANGLWFFFILGIAVSAANTGLKKQSLKTRLTPIAFKGSKAIGLCISVGLAVFIILGNASHLIGLFYYNNIRNFTISSRTPETILEKIEKVAGYAHRFDPLEAAYPFTKANTRWFLRDKTQAAANFTTALQLDPLDSRHLARYASFLARNGEEDKAGMAYEKSMIYDRSNPEYTFQYAAWQIVTEQDEKGILYMRKVLDMDETYIDRVLTAMIIGGIDAWQVEKAIPEKPGPSIAFANFLYDTGNSAEAEERYLSTLDMIEKMPYDKTHDIKRFEKDLRDYFLKIHRFFKSKKDLQHAMHVLERAEKRLPQDPWIKLKLGDLYYQMGILYKAAEKYDQVLLWLPDNKRARQQLQKINP